MQNHSVVIMCNSCTLFSPDTEQNLLSFLFFYFEHSCLLAASLSLFSFPCSQHFINSVEIRVMASAQLKEQLRVCRQISSPLLIRLSSSKSRSPRGCSTLPARALVVSAVRALESVGPTQLSVPVLTPQRSVAPARIDSICQCHSLSNVLMFDLLR